MNKERIVPPSTRIEVISNPTDRKKAWSEVTKILIRDVPVMSGIFSFECVGKRNESRVN